MLNNKRRKNLILKILGSLPFIYFALKIAPFMKKGLLYIIKHFPHHLKTEPFKFNLVDNSLQTILIFLTIYTLFLLMQSSTKPDRPGEEYGSEKWADVRILKKYCNKEKPETNKILSKNVKFSIDDRFHYKNTNILLVGGTGTGKTRYFAKPNIMQANSSYIILDPKGELLKDTASFLEEKGYKIKVINLLEPNFSNNYNPFFYIENDDEVQELADNLWKNTTPKDSKTSDPFFDINGLMLLKALMFLLLYFAPPPEQNFGMVMDLLLEDSSEENEDSILDNIFAEFQSISPNNIAFKYYKTYKNSPKKTKQNIAQTLASRIEKFNLESLRKLTSFDNMELDSLGEVKTALFCITPETSTAYNFIIGMLYTQLFQKLYSKADIEYGGRLPIPVHFIMDEFANVILPENFKNLISTMRSKFISCSIILQDLTQLKDLYKDSWETIIGNCSIFLFLGGQGKTTTESINFMLGKETITTVTRGESRGQSLSSSYNYQGLGRDLLTPSEIRRLDNSNLLVLIQGEKPIIDLKYNLKKHPNYKKITEGGGKPYILKERNTDKIYASYTLNDILNFAEILISSESELEFFAEEIAEKIEITTSEEINNIFRQVELSESLESLN